MLRVAHKRELNNANHYPKEVIEVILEAVTILDDEYGQKRNVEVDDGGYVLIIEDKGDVETAMDKLRLPSGCLHVPEYVEVIEVEGLEPYIKALFLLSSDLAIVLISPFNLTPEQILEHIQVR